MMAGARDPYCELISASACASVRPVRPWANVRPSSWWRSVTLNPRLGAVAGIEFCFDELRVLLCDLAHNVIGTAKCELPRAHGSDTALDAAGRLVGEALAAAGLSRDALIGAGVSVPGPVSRHPDAV